MFAYLQITFNIWIFGVDGDSFTALASASTQNSSVFGGLNPKLFTFSGNQFSNVSYWWPR